MLAGRSLEGVGNGSPRWMVANRAAVRQYGEQNPAYEPARPHHCLGAQAQEPGTRRVGWRPLLSAVQSRLDEAVRSWSEQRPLMAALRPLLQVLLHAGTRER